MTEEELMNCVKSAASMAAVHPIGRGGLTIVEKLVAEIRRLQSFLPTSLPFNPPVVFMPTTVLPSLTSQS
jgi:hypothetical protein